MIRLPSYFVGFSSKVDGSASLRFSTQEISSDEFKLLKDNLNEFGYLIFSSTQPSDEEIPTEPIEDTSKSPSKRLRAILWHVFKQKYPDKNDFDTYYRKVMEGIIEEWKEKLS